MLIKEVYRRYDYLLTDGVLTEEEKVSFRKVLAEMTDSEAAYSLKNLSGYLSNYYGNKVIILLDELDTPLQEAWLYGYWQEMAEYIRGLFNSTFKSNLYLERAVMTGITKSYAVSGETAESIFSDLNHLTVATSTSEMYADCFGFTEEEASLEDTAREALNQIGRQQYGAELENKGISRERIRKYGFAFGGMHAKGNLKAYIVTPAGLPCFCGKRKGTGAEIC